MFDVNVTSQNVFYTHLDGNGNPTLAYLSTLENSKYVEPIWIATASSYLEANEKYHGHFEPINVLDGKRETYWKPDDNDTGGIAEYLNIRLINGSSTKVRGISIMNGLCATRDLYYRSNRVKSVIVTANGIEGELFFELSDDQRSPQDLLFPEPVELNSIKVLVDSIYPGSNSNTDGVVHDELAISGLMPIY